MTQIDFYILPDTAPSARPLLACKLAEKAVRLGHQVYVHTESATQTQHMDELLWTFRDGSFLAHELYANAGEDPVAVLLGHDAEPEHNTDVLINLCHEVPLFFSRFERVAELVDQRPEQLSQSRERYRFYQERGYELNTHKLGGN